MSLFEKMKALVAFYEEVLSMPHRSEIARELRDQDDMFLFMLYSEMLGIPNPAYYYTLELYPYMMEQFHDWHLRMGMDKSPMTGFRCC
ncbi:cory-CC-star protein [Chryseomicrobium aureum]|uniref:cory-CC-star protein n=1 Tax=Chryseomicrobium aureum TaxID=1441723 RepID=UPI00370DC612